MSNPLIFGKNEIKGITNIEFDNGLIEIFTNDGQHKTIPAKYWFLTPHRLSSKQELLKGNQWYKYIAEFDLKEDFINALNVVRGKKKDHWRFYDEKEMVLAKSGMTYFKGLKLSDVLTLSFDIETTGLLHNKDSRVLAITNTLSNGVKKSFFLDEYGGNQANLINDWCFWVRYVNPAIMCGHNILMYDLPYLNHVAHLFGTELSLGRNDSSIRFNTYSSQYRKDGSQSYEYFNAFIYGREIVDTMFLAIKYDIARKYESYGLKQIIKQEGMEKPGRTYVDASKIGHYYYHEPKMWKLVKTYGEEDADDGLKLFNLMGAAFFYMAQSVPKSFQQIINTATGSQLNSFMVRSYIQHGYSIPKASDLAEGFEGGISIGIPGIYSNCFKQDVSSLYPSIMEQWEVCDKRKDPKQYFLETVKYFREERLKNKELAKQTNDSYYKDLEQSQKIFINSLYGFMGAPGLNFNSPLNAAFVTRKGREILSDAIQFATGREVDYWRGLTINE